VRAVLRRAQGPHHPAVLPRVRVRGVCEQAVSSLGDAKSSLGDAKSSLGDAKSSLGDAVSSLGDVKSSLGEAESLLGDAKSLLGDVYRWTRTGVAFKIIVLGSMLAGPVAAAVASGTAILVGYGYIMPKDLSNLFLGERTLSVTPYSDVNEYGTGWER
jgi:hypothetical protein